MKLFEVYNLEQYHGFHFLPSVTQLHFEGYFLKGQMWFVISCYTDF